MDCLTLDFETYYDQEYSLSKLTTEEYIRDKRFQVIGVSTKLNDEEAEWVTGTASDILRHLRKFDWKNLALLCHNTMFDGAILSWRCKLQPKMYLDTLCMGRAVHGVEQSVSLKNLAAKHGLGAKGDEVFHAKGKRRQDFTPAELQRYGDYCRQDVNLTANLFKALVRGFPNSELKLIDLTLRMFTLPTLELNGPMLEKHLSNTLREKRLLLKAAGVEDRKDLMSNNKFADLLRQGGVEPPLKISPTTGKPTYAFAKSDEEFTNLLDHESLYISALVSARLKNKSTLEETRTQRFIDISKRGKLPVPVRYYAAHTGRWGGSDKINLQNLPSRGDNAKKLKKAIEAPEGCILIDADSSQIEARTLAWLAKQDDLVAAFAAKEDVYKRMASSIYNVLEADVSDSQRFVGKTTILGAGYGMGGPKFQNQLRIFGVDVDEDEARRVIHVYRDANPQIVALWRDAQNALQEMYNGNSGCFGRGGIIKYDPEGLILPNGLRIHYRNLKAERGENERIEYTYETRKGPTRIYGGKVIENVTQALARLIVGHQMILVAKKYHVALTVHDSIVPVVPLEQEKEALEYVTKCMHQTPKWARGLPIACEASSAIAYGDC